MGVLEGDEAGIGAGEKTGVGVEEEEEEVWDFGVDDKRGWLIGTCWLIASAVECVHLSSINREGISAEDDGF